MKNKRRIIIGGGMAVLMSPVMLAGFLFGTLKMYFVAGDEMAKLAEQEVTNWLEKYDD